MVCLSRRRLLKMQLEFVVRAAAAVQKNVCCGTEQRRNAAGRICGLCCLYAVSPRTRCSPVVYLQVLPLHTRRTALGLVCATPTTRHRNTAPQDSTLQTRINIFSASASVLRFYPKCQPTRSNSKGTHSHKPAQPSFFPRPTG